MKVVLAVDQSRDSKAAARLLERLPFQAGALVTVLHVLIVPPVLAPRPGRPRQLSAWREEAARQARRFVEGIAARLAKPGVTIKTLIKEGLPEVDVVQTIDESRADLVVLGSRGLTGMRRFLLGSVSEQVLSHAPCSALIVRGTHGPRGKPKQGLRIVLATDESPDAKAALIFLEKMGLPPSSRLTVLHVTETREDAAAWLVAKGRAELQQGLERIVQARKQQTARRLERVRLRLARAGISVDVALADGHPAEEILRTAKRRRADLIVMGSRGLTGFRRFLLGSVSHKVARHAPCSVLVVRGRGQ